MVGLLAFVWYDNEEVSMLGQLINIDDFRRVFRLNEWGVFYFIFIFSSGSRSLLSCIPAVVGVKEWGIWLDISAGSGLILCRICSGGPREWYYILLVRRVGVNVVPC